MRVGLLGGGTIARLVLDAIARGALAGADAISILSTDTSHRAPMARFAA